ncbi:MAG: PEP-CTERM sorting domain-containing protein [Opitutales bacterium]
MKRTLLIPSLAFASLAFASLVSANATISIVNSAGGFLGDNKAQVTTAHNGTEQINFDATGASKLVVTIASESGFSNRAVTGMTLSFNGEAMNLAVLGNTRGVETNDAGGVAIFYLDNPFQGAATFSVGITTTAGNPNGGFASIFGLAGTADGVGNTNASWVTQSTAGEVSTTLTTSAQNSWVLGAVQNSGTNNGAGTPSVVSPLTLGHNGFWGSQWGSAATGYQTVVEDGTAITPTFNTNAGANIQIIAAEFQAIPEPSAALLACLGMLALIRRRR